MNPDQILAHLYASLKSWAAQKKAQLSIAQDPFHALEILAESPAGFRIILHWAGDTQLGDQDQLPLSTNLIEVTLSYNLGLTAEPDLALLANRIDRPSVLKLLGDLRGRILSTTFPDESSSVFPSYQGAEPVVLPSGLSLAAYTLSFRIDSLVSAPEPIHAFS